MNEDLEQSWTLLEEQCSEPVELIEKQLEYLQSIMLSSTDFVLEKIDGLIKRAKQSGDLRCMAAAKAILGNAYYIVSSYDKALPVLHEALHLIKSIGDTHIEFQLNGTIALVHISLGNFQTAMRHGYKTRELIREIGDRVQEGWTLHGFGLCFLEMGLQEKALSSFEESLQIFKEEDVPNGIARALTNIGSIYSQQQKYEEALELHERCLSLFQQTNNKSGIARALNDLGGVYLHLKNFDKARHFLKESLKLRTELGFKQAKSSTLGLLGALASAENAPQEAITYYQEALHIAYEVRAKKRIFEIHKVLAELYESQEAYKEANTHLKAYYECRHQIFDEQISTKINSIKTTFELEQAQKETEFAQQKNIELREKNKELKGLLSELQAAQSKLLHAEKLASLGELTAGIAHEIKNPLNFVNNFAALSADILEELKTTFEDRKKEQLDAVLPDVQDLIDDLHFNSNKINEHGKRADQIIQSMLKHARGKKDHRQPTDINRVLMEYAKLAYHGMRASSTSFYVSIIEEYSEALPQISATPHDLGRVFLNIMNNAFYAMKEKTKIEGKTYTPELKIETLLKKDHIEISISDNGTGIPDAIRKDIFNPFFTTKPSGMGTGLGLSLSYEIIHNEHGGDFYLAQTSAEGTTFIVKLPVPSTHQHPLPMN